MVVPRPLYWWSMAAYNLRKSEKPQHGARNDQPWSTNTQLMWFPSSEPRCPLGRLERRSLDGAELWALFFSTWRLMVCFFWWVLQALWHQNNSKLTKTNQNAVSSLLAAVTIRCRSTEWSQRIDCPRHKLALTCCSSVQSVGGQGVKASDLSKTWRIHLRWFD